MLYTYIHTTHITYTSFSNLFHQLRKILVRILIHNLPTLYVKYISISPQTHPYNTQHYR